MTCVRNNGEPCLFNPGPGRTGKTSYQVLHTYYSRGETFDGIIRLGAHRADHAKYAVRLVTFRQGNTLHRYITNVHDPRIFSMTDMAQLYAGT